MRGPILLVCLLMLASGCGKSKKDNKVSDGGGSDTRPALTKESSTLDVAKDHLQGSGYSDINVVSKEEKPTTLYKKPAVALHLQWTSKGDSEPKNSLLLIQDGKVKGDEKYDAGKSFEENIAMVVKMVEGP